MRECVVREASQPVKQARENALASHRISPPASHPCSQPASQWWISKLKGRMHCNLQDTVGACNTTLHVGFDPAVLTSRRTVEPVFLQP